MYHFTSILLHCNIEAEDDIPPRCARLYRQWLGAAAQRFNRFALADCVEAVRREFRVRGEHAGAALLHDCIQIFEDHK
jgi:hypothetical protein